MRRFSGFCIALVFFTWSVPASGQEFLKQLEQKLLQKKPADTASKPDSKQEVAPKSEESDGDLPAPSLLTPKADAPSSAANKESGIEIVSPSLDLGQKKSETVVPARPLQNSLLTPKRTVPPPPVPNPPGAISTADLSSPFPESTQPSAVPNVGGGGYLGMTVESAAGGGFGLVVVDVTPQSPAWKAGFRIGDRVIGVAGQAVTSVDAFANQLAKYSPGVPVKFLVDRRGRNANLIAVLQDRNLAGQLQGAVPGTSIDLSQPGPVAMPNSHTAYFGVNVADMSDAFRRKFGIGSTRGAAVTEVVHGSPAESIGLQPGDCITEIDGVAVFTGDMVFDAIARSVPGHVMNISFYHGRQLINTTVTLVATQPTGVATGNPHYPATPNALVGPEMLTPEYVTGLQDELSRVQSELQATQARLAQLEAKLQSIEKNR